MSALAMILTAAMAIPGNGPEMEPGEIAQGLDLSGEWDGTLKLPGGALTFRLSKGRMLVKTAELTEPVAIPVSFTDEGAGKVRWRSNNKKSLLGIYRQEGDRIIASFRRDRYPKVIQVTNEQSLLILRRVKPRKCLPGGFLAAE
ncbi:MAG TPA: hypothetical protein VMG10_07375 [Gemmataceae bacterium]|nr:hypothetical protein [Gemmataceae bacterium]